MKVFSPAYGAVVAFLITMAYEHVMKFYQWPPSASLTGVAAMGIVFLVLYEWIGESDWYNRWGSPISKIEGSWKINIRNLSERPISVCRIYHRSHQIYIYHGYGINEDGTIGAEWKSRDVHYDEDKNDFSFTSDATLLKDMRRLRVNGYISFFKNSEDEYVYGTGYFVDMSEELEHYHMTLTRISEKEFDKMIDEMFAKTKSLVDLANDSDQSRSDIA